MKILIIFLTFFLTLCQGENDVRLIFFGDSLDDYQIIDLANQSHFQSLSASYFDSSKSNVIYIHGWLENPFDEDTSAMASAYLTRKSDSNLILVDWSDYSTTIGITLIPYEISGISTKINGILDYMKNYNFNIENTHLIGFSFGSLIAGNVARFFKTYRSLTFPRLTALDPAYGFGIFNPHYLKVLWLPPVLVRISRSDAAFVDIIHTNAGAVGDKIMRGHAEFWPDGGINQDGCEILTFAVFQATFTLSANLANVACSHNRAARYYTESVLRTSSPAPFVGKVCSSFSTITNLPSSCITDSAVSMGFFALASIGSFNATATTHYKIDVNSASPFSMC